MTAAAEVSAAPEGFSHEAFLYSSPAEFVTHALENELAKLEDADSEEEIKKRLKGLGYIS